MKETRHVSRQTRCDLSPSTKVARPPRVSGRRKNTIRAAKAAVKTGQYAFRDRKRKRTFHALWIQRINAPSASVQHDLQRLYQRPVEVGHHGGPQGAMDLAITEPAAFERSLKGQAALAAEARKSLAAYSNSVSCPQRGHPATDLHR